MFTLRDIYTFVCEIHADIDSEIRSRLVNNANKVEFRSHIDVFGAYLNQIKKLLAALAFRLKFMFSYVYMCLSIIPVY